MRKFIARRVVIWGIILTSYTVLHAQAGFKKAQRNVSKFWTAVAQDGRNPASRERLSRQGAELPGTIQPLLSQGILEYLNSNASISVDQLTLRIAEALSAPGVGVRSIADAKGVASVVPIPGRNAYAVAYTVSYCASCSRSWLGIFQMRKRKFALLASLNDPAPDEAVYLSVLGVGATTLLVLHGTHWGDAHNRLDARAYSTTRPIREVWSRLGLPQGKIVISTDKIGLVFMSSPVPPWKEIKDTYQVREGRLILVHHTSAPVRE